MQQTPFNQDPLHPHLAHLTEDEQYEIMERAAIMEYDAKISRRDAEMNATGGLRHEHQL